MLGTQKEGKKEKKKRKKKRRRHTCQWLRNFRKVTIKFVIKLCSNLF